MQFAGGSPDLTGALALLRLACVVLRTFCCGCSKVTSQKNDKAASVGLGIAGLGLKCSAQFSLLKTVKNKVTVEGAGRASIGVSNASNFALDAQLSSDPSGLPASAVVKATLQLQLGAIDLELEGNRLLQWLVNGLAKLSIFKVTPPLSFPQHVLIFLCRVCAPAARATLRAWATQRWCRCSCPPAGAAVRYVAETIVPAHCARLRYEQHFIEKEVETEVVPLIESGMAAGLTNMFGKIANKTRSVPSPSLPPALLVRGHGRCRRVCPCALADGVPF